jgi:outer membrane protein insertion porin family
MCKQVAQQITSQRLPCDFIDIIILQTPCNFTESIITDNKLTKGKVVNENLITTTKNAIVEKYRKDGFYNTKVGIQTFPDTTGANLVKMKIDVNRGEKIKITSIDIEGNEKLKDKKIRKAMKNTKKELFGRFWKGSKYIKDEYKEDLVSIIDKYKEKGYRDARIISDSVAFNKEKEKINIKLKLEEGRQYYFGNIKFIGNSVNQVPLPSIIFPDCSN